MEGCGEGAMTTGKNFVGDMKTPISLRMRILCAVIMLTLSQVTRSIIVSVTSRHLLQVLSTTRSRSRLFVLWRPATSPAEDASAEAMPSLRSPEFKTPTRRSIQYM